MVFSGTAVELEALDEGNYRNDKTTITKRMALNKLTRKGFAAVGHDVKVMEAPCVGLVIQKTQSLVSIRLNGGESVA